VRDRSRHKYQRAGSGPPVAVPAESLELAIQDQERLVACLVDMGRRREAGRHPVIDDAHPALAVATADLVDSSPLLGVVAIPWLAAPATRGRGGAVDGADRTDVVCAHGHHDSPAGVPR